MKRAHQPYRQQTTELSHSLQRSEKIPWEDIYYQRQLDHIHKKLAAAEQHGPVRVLVQNGKKVGG